MPTVAEMAIARAKAKKQAAKTTTTATKKAPAKKADKKKNGKKSEKSGTPRANSKTAQILDLLKSGSTKESIRKKFGMARPADVQWYVAKLKASGRLPENFKAKE